MFNTIQKILITLLITTILIFTISPYAFAETGGGGATGTWSDDAVSGQWDGASYDHADTVSHLDSLFLDTYNTANGTSLNSLGELIDDPTFLVMYQTSDRFLEVWKIKDGFTNVGELRQVRIAQEKSGTYGDYVDYSNLMDGFVLYNTENGLYYFDGDNLNRRVIAQPNVDEPLDTSLIQEIFQDFYYRETYDNLTNTLLSTDVTDNFAILGLSSSYEYIYSSRFIRDLDLNTLYAPFEPITYIEPDRDLTNYPTWLPQPPLPPEGFEWNYYLITHESVTVNDGQGFWNVYYFKDFQPGIWYNIEDNINGYYKFAMTEVYTAQYVNPDNGWSSVYLDSGETFDYLAYATENFPFDKTTLEQKDKYVVSTNLELTDIFAPDESIGFETGYEPWNPDNLSNPNIVTEPIELNVPDTGAGSVDFNESVTEMSEFIQSGNIQNTFNLLAMTLTWLPSPIVSIMSFGFLVGFLVMIIKFVRG